MGPPEAAAHPTKTHRRKTSNDRNMHASSRKRKPPNRLAPRQRDEDGQPWGLPTPEYAKKFKARDLVRAPQTTPKGITTLESPIHAGHREPAPKKARNCQHPRGGRTGPHRKELSPTKKVTWRGSSSDGGTKPATGNP